MSDLALFIPCFVGRLLGSGNGQRASCAGRAQILRGAYFVKMLGGAGPVGQGRQLCRIRM